MIVQPTSRLNRIGSIMRLQTQTLALLFLFLNFAAMLSRFMRAMKSMEISLGPVTDWRL
jgi:hypothetical protein